MTNLEYIATKMTRNGSTPLFALVCGFWLKDHGCQNCTLRLFCEGKDMPSDEWMENWLKENVEVTE